MAVSQKIQNKRAKRKRNQRIKKAKIQKAVVEQKRITKALENVAYASIDNKTELDKVLEQLNPYEYGKSWGIGGDKKLKAKMDKIVAEEIDRLERPVVENTDEVGNFNFGESE